MKREFLDITIEDVTPIMGVKVSMVSPQLSVEVEDITPRLMVECEQVYEVEEGGVLYTPLEYIESTGTQWIDTLIVPNNKTEIELKVSSISANSFSTSSGTWFFGARMGYLSNALGAYYNPTNNNLYYAFENALPFTRYTDLYEKEKVFRANNTGFYIDNKKIVSVQERSFSTPCSLTLFGLNNNGSVISLTKFKLHYCKMWDNGVLVRDFIPVIDDKNIPCLYDLVNEEFYYNKGTGEFIPSPLPNKYTELQYIESTGTQWIDTGYAFNDDFSWEIDFEGITLNKTVFGGRTSTNRTALLYQYNVNNITTCPIGSSNGQKTPFQLGNLSKGRHVVKMSVAASKGSVWVDGVQKYNNTSFAGAYITGTTQAIFADNFGGGDIQEFTNSKVYGLKMWQGTTLVRDFIPVLDKESTPCMYDKVSGEYFYNQGTNNFLYELK